MTGSDLVIFTVLYLFSIIGLPMLFIWFDQEEVQPFDKSKLEFKDGDSKNRLNDNIRLLCANCYYSFNGYFPSAKKFCK